MKTAPLILVMLASAVLIAGTGQVDRTASGEHRDQSSGHASRKPQQSRPGSPARSSLSKPLPKRQMPSAPVGVTNPLRGPARIFSCNKRRAGSQLNRRKAPACSVVDSCRN